MEQDVAESSASAGTQPVTALDKPLPPTPEPPIPSLRRKPSNPTLRPPPPRSYLTRPSIRIQRQPSYRSEVDVTEAPRTDDNASVSRVDYADAAMGRRRSSSEPQRPQWVHGGDGQGIEMITRKPVPQMPHIAEEGSRAEPGPSEQQAPSTQRARGSSFLGRRRARTVSSAGAPRNSRPKQTRPATEYEYDSDLIDLLDVVDPEVSTLTSLTNVQNSLFVPDLGKYLNRRPTYTLTRHESSLTSNGKVSDIGEESSDEEEKVQGGVDEGKDNPPPSLARTQTLDTITSQVSDTANHYAVLPHGRSLTGWSTADKQELNDHVRHMLHSKRSKFKRGMKGFRQYISKPLGFLVTLYATLITLFGLAWVLFLIGWINVGGRQSYLINVIDNVLVALFAVMGDGLAPFRAVDTYHMIFIAHYHHLTWRLRKEKQLPELENENDLPLKTEKDVERADDGTEVTVLTDKQLQRLIHHQTKFSKSHTFYKPHETATHYAFPLRLLVAIVVLCDFHSIFQIALGTCTWAISYHVRPFALTTVILCFSISCNITAGILIMVGDRQSRKKEVVERMFRQELTDEAIRKLEKKKRKEARQKAELEAAGVPNVIVMDDGEVKPY